MPEPLLLTTTRVSTFRGRQLLTAATAFFFQRDDGLFLVTSRHVLHDEPSGHFPDRIELVLHVDATDLTRTARCSISLYRDGRASWRQATDSGGPVDVAVIQLENGALPNHVVLRAFAPEDIQLPAPDVEAGASVRVVAFPLGFYDTRHHLPVVRHAIVASSFGIRFQGDGYFLTDGRLHRGTSGAPVVLRRSAGDGKMPWLLLGVHSARLDTNQRDASQDDTLGLNCAWYADILMALTRPHASLSKAEMGPRPGTRERARPAGTREGQIVSNTDKRNEWDQHNRDEAEERAAQQQAAGPDHSPVPMEAYASLSGPPSEPDRSLTPTLLVDEYELAVLAERAAWLAIRDRLAIDARGPSWNAWRDAVERTQQAARSLVDTEFGETAAR